MKYISVIIMSLFLIGNANAKGPYDYVRISVEANNLTPIIAELYLTLKECKQVLIDNMEYDTNNGYRVEFIKTEFNNHQTINYWKNQRQPVQTTTCMKVFGH